MFLYPPFYKYMFSNPNSLWLLPFWPWLLLFRPDLTQDTKVLPSPSWVSLTFATLTEVASGGTLNFDRIPITYLTFNSSSYAGSDGTTREESQAQLPGGKGYDNGGGNTNKGASYYISPEGKKISLTWTADENGYLPKGDHLPVAPALPYTRSGMGI